VRKQFPVDHQVWLQFLFQRYQWSQCQCPQVQ
jgi:hypothetical protein